MAAANVIKSDNVLNKFKPTYSINYFNQQYLEKNERENKEIGNNNTAQNLSAQSPTF